MTKYSFFQRSIILKSVGVIAIILSLTACSNLLRPIPANKTGYMINVSIPATQFDIKKENVTTHPATILVEDFSVAPAFSSRYFTYKKTSVIYDRDYYDYFFVAPNVQITDILHRWIVHTIPLQVLNDNDLQKPDYILQGKIDQLYIDIENPLSQQAVLKISVRLLKNTAEGETLIFQKGYQSLIPIQHITGTNFVNAWSTGLKDILNQIQQDLVAFTK